MGYKVKRVAIKKSTKITAFLKVKHLTDNLLKKKEYIYHFAKITTNNHN